MAYEKPLFSVLSKAMQLSKLSASQILSKTLKTPAFPQAV